jgi:hypothetical protein
MLTLAVEQTVCYVLAVVQTVCYALAVVKEVCYLFAVVRTNKDKRNAGNWRSS